MSDIWDSYEKGTVPPKGIPLRRDNVVSILGQGHLPGFEPPSKRLPLIYFDDIKPRLEATDFVRGLLVERSSGVIYGRSNSGKTFFTTDLALHIAAGMRWRDRRVEQGAVIYVVLEGGIGFQNRVEAWRRQYRVQTPVAFAAINMPINLLNPEADTMPLIEALKEASAALAMPVKLTIIDTLSRAMAGGNENAPEDMTALVANMDRVRHETGSSVFFVHHSGKDEAKGARGHSSLQAAIDTEIEVVATEDGQAVTRIATVVKQRDLPKGDAFEFALKVVEIGTNQHDEPVTSCIVENPDGEASAGAALPRRRPAKSARRAFEVLADLTSSMGRTGYAGTPADVPSVPEEWWRNRFYESAEPGASQDAKQKAFSRAAKALMDERFVGMSAGRVWVASRTP